jgi:hypothetical protein
VTRPVRTDVVVAIPAHNEQDLLPGCLEAVLAAIAHAQAEGAVGRAVVAVAAHRCTDRTAHVARYRLAAAAAHHDGSARDDGSGGHGTAGGMAGPPTAWDWVVVEDHDSATVAEVRRSAIEAATDRLDHLRAQGRGPGFPTGSLGRGPGGGQHAGGTPEAVWLFNTDADSRVPPEWITGMLRVAAREGSSAVAGLVEVADWHAHPQARHAYDVLVARGIQGSRHDHAYGANLAVRLDAHQAVGGFTARPHGEDRDLLHRLRAAGFGVATPLSPRVTTSGREEPRCPDGLGALLHRLSCEAGAG